MAKDILQHRYYLTVKHQHKHTVCGFYYKEKGEKKYLFVCACVCVCVCRGVVEGRRGWSVLLKEPAQWVELEGSDYVLDLMSDLELPADFPKHSSYFIISAQEPTRVRPNASM